MTAGSSNSINSSLGAFNALNNLKKTGFGFQKSLNKLSSGIRINTAADGPADLIISEFLRAENGGIQRAIRNTQESFNVLGIAEGGLGQISGQLTQLRELAVQALNSGVTSGQQTAALQAGLSGALSAIANIANTTGYAGQNLLDGSQAFTYGLTDAEGIIDTGATRIDSIADVQGLEVAVEFSGDAADQAERAVLETDFGGGSTTFASDQEFTVTGSEGSVQFNFAAGSSIADAVDQINARSDSTGVTAYATDGDSEIRLTSNDYGSSQEVRVEQTTGDAFAAAGSTAVDAGQDLTVTIDGQQVTGDGLTVAVETPNVSGSFTFEAGEAVDPTDPTQGVTSVAQGGYDLDTLVDTTTAREAAFGDLEGGMRFQLGGGSGTQNRTIFGIGSADPSQLGRVTANGENYTLNDLRGGGSAALARDPAVALQVIDQAIADVSAMRGRIGAFQANTLQTNANSLEVAMANIAATESDIRDTNMAAEVSELVKFRLLRQAGMFGVQSNNVSAENVLRLLGGA